MATPNIEGFFAAQERLRQEMGVDATFVLKTPLVWPVGTQLNPETNKPFDPTIKPSSGGEEVEVIVRCSMVNRLVASNIAGATADTAAGVFREGDIALGLGADRYDEVKDAAEVRVAGVGYRVADIRPDPAFNQVRRYIAFCENR